MLDHAFIERMQRRIKAAIVPVMERTYGAGESTFGADFRPELKTIEKIVSYHDYFACGISVLAEGVTKGDERASRLFRTLTAVVDHYRRHIFRHNVGGQLVWPVPLRRLLLHLALVYERAGLRLAEQERRWLEQVIDEQVPLAIEHCRHFLPGEKDLHLASVNNHTAIFMQGIYHCGRVLNRPEWVTLTRDFAERFYASGHPDGYFEENTNAARPSCIHV